MGKRGLRLSRSSGFLLKSPGREDWRTGFYLPEGNPGFGAWSWFLQDE